MIILEAIQKRRSIRTFDGNPLKEEDAQKILNYANSVTNPYNIPVEWRLLDAKNEGLNSPVIVGTDTYIAGKMSRVPHAEEAFGYAFEKIVLFAEALGVGTTWIAGTMNRDAFERAMKIIGDEVMPCVSPLGYPSKKMSLRETMMRKGIRADSRIKFGELFFDKSFENSLTAENAGKLKNALEAVRLAPSAVNKQPWRIIVCEDMVHFYEMHSKGYVAANGWDMQKIDMGIALCHFDLIAKESGMSVSFEIADPGIQMPEGLSYIASYRVK